MAAATECAHCDEPIEPVTMTGVTVWSHVTDKTYSPYVSRYQGPRMCGNGKETMATPKGTA